MPTNTYVALATQTLGSSAASVTFSSISSGYTDLRLVMQARTDTVNNVDYAVVKLNNDASSLYSRTEVYGDGTSAGSFRASNFLIGLSSTAAGGNTQIKSMTTMDFMNYSNATTNKTVLYSQGSNDVALRGVGLYRSTSAISTITLTPFYGSWQAGSTFTIYGIASTDKFALATGGYLYEDSTYWYHVFAGNGTFTPKQSLTADILVVAGGGAGANGGGGAGGLRAFTSQALTASNYTVTIGGGGAGRLDVGTGPNGSNSQFGALAAATGGGGGGSATYPPPGAGNGGSGGGGDGRDGITGGTGIAGQGYAGGNGNRYSANVNEPGGGGGGAGAVGVTATSTPGAGGVGSAAYSSWASVVGVGQNVSGTYYLAGGGGGGNWANTGLLGAGGLGGGGGGSSQVGVSGLPSTGGGGSGSVWCQNRVSGSGGSGVVIVRYAK